MNTRRNLSIIGILVIALVAMAGLSVSSTSAAKIPTYLVYKQCTSKTSCKAAAYTLGNKIETLQISGKCSDGRVTVSGSAQGVKFSRKTGKFKASMPTSSYSYATGEVINGTMEVTGKVSKKKKVSGSYTVDKAVAECAGVLSGKFSAKYKGTQKGG